MAGIEIDPSAPGYKRIILQATPGEGLTWVEAHLDTLYGRVESSWKLEGGGFHWDVTVPPNTSAVAIMPSGERRELTSGRHRLSE